MTQNFDMFDMWKNFYNQYSTSFDEKMKESFPSQAMAQILDMNLLYQKMLNETTERYLEQMNVPTRTDLAKISSLIVNVDSKVDDLEELLEETKGIQQNHVDMQSQITDLGIDLKSLETKLNQILTQLNSLNDVNNKKAAEDNGAADKKDADMTKEPVTINVTPKEANNKEAALIKVTAKKKETAKSKKKGK